MIGSHPLWRLGAAFSMLVLGGCGPYYEDMAERRTTYALTGEGSIVIAVIDDGPDSAYLDGVRLALDRINATDGGLLGRRVELLVRPGSDDFNSIRSTVQRIADTPQVTAVLGHKRSDVAIPASVIYEKARVLFMPPFASSEQLTLHGFDFVLRMLPDNKTMAAQSASLASLLGYRRMVVVHSRDDYSREVAFLFEDAARRFDIGIAFRGSFFGAETNYRDLIGQLNGVDFDAVYLSTDTEPGARFLNQLRELGLRQPVLGSDTLNYGPLAELSASAGDRTIVPTVFTPNSTAESKKRFERAYTEAYGRIPTQAAAQGYESAEILATIIKRAGTTEPRVLATTAHFSAPMAGVTGIVAFDPRGNIHGKSYRFQILRFERWWSLPGLTQPYRLARFQDVLESKEAAEPSAQASLENKTAAVAAANGDAVDQSQAAALVAQGAKESNDARAVDTPREAGGAADEKVLDLAALTSERISIIERNQIWLALVQEILNFKRLGLVAAPTESGVAAIGLARTVAARQGFEVEVCSLSEKDKGQADADASDRTEYERAALACYSQLARRVDAMFVVPDSGLEPAYLNRLNRILRGFGVPAFSLAESVDADYGLTLALVSSGVDLDDPSVALRFNGVLKDMRVHELNRKIAALPTVSVSLTALEELGIHPDPRELTVVTNVLESSQPALESSAAPTSTEEPK